MLFVQIVIKHRLINHLFRDSTASMQRENPLKIVAVSDTHSSTAQLDKLIKDQISGDIFIHAGDFTGHGHQQDFLNFFDRLEHLQFKHKIVIAGNNEISLDPHMDPVPQKRLLEDFPCKLSRQQILQKLRLRAHYLEHEMIQIEGLKIFGSPHTQVYNAGAFQYRQSQEEVLWNNLPEHIDILVTHGPPFGILDKNKKGQQSGSKYLLKAVQKIKPRFHIFGHIHESHGIQSHFGVQFMNVAKLYEMIEYT